MRCTRTRGKKGAKHRDPTDPPRRRANKRRGHGTWDSDRPPVVGVVGRETGRVYLEVVHNADRATLERVVEDNTAPGCTVYTDEWGSYAHLPELDRPHAAVCHTPGKRGWARDDDGDGVREVHDNTLEGLWAGLRNFLRPFRGVSKYRLQQYVAMFQWAYNLKAATDDFLRTLLGIRPSTT
jgi:transposase-like protein